MLNIAWENRNLHLDLRRIASLTPAIFYTTLENKVKE